MKNILIFDGTNIAHRTFFAHQHQAGNDIGGLAIHFAITTFNKYYNVYKPTETFVAFDRSNWRKAYTTSGQSLTKAVYKGNRRKNMTPQQQLLYADFQDHISQLESLLDQATTINVVSCDQLEADDIIAGLVNRFPDDNITVVSADGDFKQLLKHHNVRLINPMEDKQVFCDDVEWFMFEKCMRGDVGDNVKSALPRVRSTRLQKAFTDPMEYANLMASTWTDGTTEYRVQDLFEENQLLMDLEKQPADIKGLIQQCIDKSLNQDKKYNHFQFLKFCGKFGLQRVIDNIHKYVDFLSSNQRDRQG